jgi:hypothetical protein
MHLKQEGLFMADPEILRRALCLHRSPENVKDEAFIEKSDFFDPRDIVQVKYELLRRCQIDGKDVASACLDFGFSRTTYYKVQQAFLAGGLPSLMGRQRGRPNPIKVTDVVLGYTIAEKAKNPKLTAREMVAALEARYQLQLSVRMVQHIWQHYNVSKKTQLD